jgi:hypothetical protein
MGQMMDPGSGYDLPYRLSLIEQQIQSLFNNGGVITTPESTYRHVASGWGGKAPISFPDGRARGIREMIWRRRRRESHFPADLFADPAWDMLLDLYASHYEQKTVSVSSLAIAAAVPSTTALRWIKLMSDEGLFVRAADPDDGRRIYIALSDDGRERMDNYFGEMTQGG